MKDDEKTLLIYGCGGHARSVGDVALTAGFAVLNFYDENAQADELCLGFPVRKTLPEEISSKWPAFPAVGDHAIRQQQFTHLQELGFTITSVISPHANVSSNTSILPGVFVGHHAHIGPQATIAMCSIINTAAIIEHDCRIGIFSHVAVNATLCGNVSIGERCFIGAGATIINNVKICSDVTIGAGSVVVEDIDEPGTYVGVPARKVKP